MYKTCVSRAGIVPAVKMAEADPAMQMRRFANSGVVAVCQVSQQLQVYLDFFYPELTLSNSGFNNNNFLVTVSKCV